MKRTEKYPIGASITPEQLEGDLHPIMHRLRESEPVSWLPSLKTWLITRRDLCVEVMRDAKLYTVDHPGFSTGQVVGPSMLSLDGADQKRHRDPFEYPFRKREVEARFSSSVESCIAGLIDGFVGDGSAELRRDYAGPIAVHAMIAALGLEATPVEQVLTWYDTIVDAVTRVSLGEAVSSEGRAAFDSLRESLLPSLRNDRDASLLAAASGMAQGLSDDEIISNAAVLLFGGIETTEGMIANALYFLLTNRTVLDEVRADYSLIPAVTEETLRLEPAASVVDRYATAHVTLAGAEIAEGDLVRVSLVAANRDPDTFENPDAFDPHRPNLRSHVTFAQGPHVCLGIHLARLEVQQAVAQLLRRIPALSLRTDAASQQAAKPTGLVFRKSQALNVLW